jgi:hypothetical protein
MRKVTGYILAATLLAVSGCSGTDADNSNEMVGTATFELTNAPADATCLRIVAAGSRTTTRLIDLMPGQATTFTLNGLPLGNVTFTESAYALLCSAVTDTSIATWQSDPTPATLQAGVAANVTVVLRRNGTARVTSDFQDDTPACMMPFILCTDGSGMPQCVDVSADRNNCGACGHSCPPVTNAAPVCVSAVCSFICNVQFRDCNNSPMDGCETNVNSDPVNCGACGLVCQAGSTCQNGMCTAPARIQVTPQQTQFPATRVGEFSNPMSVTISNVGGSPLTLLSEILTGPNPNDFAFLTMPPPILPPGASAIIQLDFEPLAQGLRTATLQVQSNDPMQPFFGVQLIGQGLPPSNL